LDILAYIVGMFKCFSEAEKENEDVGHQNLLHGQKGQKTLEDVNFRIAEIGYQCSHAEKRRTAI
jgi:hypothetical protein